MDDAFWGFVLLVLGGAIPVTLLTLGALAFLAAIRLNTALEQANRRIAALEAEVEEIRSVGVRIVSRPFDEPPAAVVSDPPSPQAAPASLAAWILCLLLIAGPWVARYAIQTAPGVPLLSGEVAALALVAAAAATAALSLRHGAGLGALALVAGFTAPGALRLAEAEPIWLFGGLSVGVVAALAFLAWRGQRGLAWIVAVGALVWPVAWAAFAFTAQGHVLAAGHLALTAVAFAAFGWRDPAGARAPNGSVAVVILAGAGLAAFAATGGHAPLTLMLLVGFVGAATAAATAHPGFGAAAAGTFGFALLALGAWRVEAQTVSLFFAASGAFGLIASVGGGAMAARGSTVFGAGLAGVGPVFVLLVATARLGPILPPAAWSAAVLFVALLNAAMAWRSPKGPARIGFAVGALVAALGAAALSVFGLVATLVIVAVGAGAFVWRRRARSADPNILPRTAEH